MKNPDLPEPIAAYFDADRQDAQAVARCFTENGLVLDEGKTHTGLAAIKAWKADSTSRYSYTATPRTLEKQGRGCIVTAIVAGSFPGSPVELRYAFTLERDKVAMLEIAP